MPAQAHLSLPSACGVDPLPGRAGWRCWCLAKVLLGKSEGAPAAWAILVVLRFEPMPIIAATLLARSGNADWGNVCAEPTIKQTVAAAACRQLGFAGGVLASQGLYPPDELLYSAVSHVDCAPGAANLNACFYAGNDGGPPCDGPRFLSINCTAA